MENKMKDIIEKALNDAFVAGRSKQSFEDFKKEWLSENTIRPKDHFFLIKTLIEKLQNNIKHGYKTVTITEDWGGKYLLLEK